MSLIEGHTDAVGSDEDNLSLSDRRAEAVAEILTREFQVPAENLSTQWLWRAVFEDQYAGTGACKSPRRDQAHYAVVVARLNRREALS